MLYILFSVCYICQQSGIHVPPIIRREVAKKEGQTIMKRILAAMLALCLCAAGVAMAQEETEEWAAGDVVVFGSYEQDNVLTNGKEPLEWIVLKTEDGRAMLITRYLIDARAYHEQFVNMTWSECTLRQWLNDTFLKEAFSQEEQARIQEVLVVNDDNPHYSTRGGEDTLDRVFLLSEAELLEFFPEQEQRTCQATEYAKAQGAYVDENNGNSWWWLRSPGVRPVDACGVRADGRISGYGSRDVNRPSGSLRPVIWVTMGE